LGAVSQLEQCSGARARLLVAALSFCTATCVYAVSPVRAAWLPVRSAGCSASTTREPCDPHSFFGYLCRDDECSGHKAGFAYADRHGIADAGACAVLADAALTEGCRTYVEAAVTAEQAGFEWARDNEVADPCHCAGAGARFEAGCEVYATGFSQ